MSIKGNKIVFQGDSITDSGRIYEELSANKALGWGYAAFSAFRLFATMPEQNFQIYNRGINCHRVVDLYARWKIDALNLNPDILSILVGVNDFLHEAHFANGVEIERYEDIYRLLLQWTKRELPMTKLILCEPFAADIGMIKTEWLPEIRQRGEVVRTLAREFNAIFIPFQSIFDHAMKRAPAAYWFVDGVHPTEAGHMLMAETWLDAVLENKN